MAHRESIEEFSRELVRSLPGGKIRGTDSDGGKYKDLSALWALFAQNKKDSSGEDTASGSAPVSIEEQGDWYSKAFDYWESASNCPTSDNGVLGGFGHLTPVDARDSLRFLDQLKAQRPQLKFDAVADCGSGIGRVAKSVLLHRFRRVVCVEQSPRLLAAVPGYLCETSAHGDPLMVHQHKRGKIPATVSAAERAKKLLVCDPVPDAMERVTCLCKGLQHFLMPAPAAGGDGAGVGGGEGGGDGSYDVIWIQWVIGHLTDEHYVDFFRRCAAGLRPGGVVVVKDNVTDDCTYMIDCDDSSVARCIEYHKFLLRRAGLTVVMETVQRDFPEELCPVHMIALAPDSYTQEALPVSVDAAVAAEEPPAPTSVFACATDAAACNDGTATQHVDM